MSHHTNTTENLPDGINVVDGEGNVIPHQGVVELPSNQSYINLAELRQTHDYFIKEEKSVKESQDTEENAVFQNSVNPTITYDTNPGVSLDINDARKHRLDLLDILANKRKAEGRIVNPGPYARQNGLSESSVVADAMQTAEFNRKKATEVFGALLGRNALHAAGIDTSSLPTVDDYESNFFGDKKSDARRNKERKLLRKLIR